MNKNKNWNCDNEYCLNPNGEIRVLPTGGSGNALLCHACYEYEMSYRREHNKKYLPFNIPAWESLRIYDAGE